MCIVQVKFWILAKDESKKKTKWSQDVRTFRSSCNLHSGQRQNPLTSKNSGMQCPVVQWPRISLGQGQGQGRTILGNAKQGQTNTKNNPQATTQKNFGEYFPLFWFWPVMSIHFDQITVHFGKNMVR